MLMAFEGTGDESHERAKFIRQNGYVWQFCKFYLAKSGSPAHYVPGPQTDGLNLYTIFMEARAFFDTWLKRPASQRRVDIIGYSRGGYLAMGMARYVGKKHGMRVNFLGLIDPVRMGSLMVEGYDTHEVSGNVDFLFRYTRDTRTGSRSSWGNTGYLLESGIGTVDQATFMTSHSGMGGWPGGGDLSLSDNGDEIAESWRAARRITQVAGAKELISGSLKPLPWNEAQS